MIISMLLLGNQNTRKTNSVKALKINVSPQNPVTVYSHDMQTDTVTRKINIWDTKSSIKDLPRHVMLRCINVCVIFCNLSNTKSCNDVSYWYSCIQKYRPGIETIIVSVCDGENDNTQKNQQKLLKWCQNDIKINLPYFKISSSNADVEFCQMYKDLTEHIAQKLKLV